MNTTENREVWLMKSVALMEELFEAKGYHIPALRVSCGWPHSGGTKASKRTLGQCWAQESATDGVTQIFISPYLADSRTEQGVVSVLIHEVCHAVVGVAEKHNKVFGKCARAVGLEGKMTSTIAGENLLVRIDSWVALLGTYPHASLDLTKSPTKKQTTRMIKMTCKECGYTARTTKKWLEDVGAAHCPKHGEMAYEKPEDEGEGDDEGKE